MNKIWLVLFLWILTLGTKPLAASQQAFSFSRLADLALQSAQHPFQKPQEIPDFLKNITYDQWRDIRFKNTYTLWGQRDSSFKIRFFHPGFYYRWPVAIHYVDGSGIQTVRFSPDSFDYGKNDWKSKVPADLGFAGFRIHYPVNRPDYEDEIAVFLGASYFRALARGQRYGMSARGLAIDTAVDSGEEFPFFKEFWIIRPRKTAKEITVYALLDSPSVSGAYEYVIRPGKETLMHVHSRLFFRKKVEKLGIAPLTSMYFYGENSKIGLNDGFRPQVHDSDGLSIFSRSGEWIWRPLVNPDQLSVNTFEVGTPQGFGLLQRDTDFDHYQDLESRFELRPSVWVVPDGDWGAGHVELVQIPTSTEQNDNINVFWVPQDPPSAGQRMDFNYILKWCSSQAEYPPIKGRVAATRIARPEDKDGARFEIDFEGKYLDAFLPSEDLKADISVTKGYHLKDQQLYKNAVTGGWRLVFRIEKDQQDPLKGLLAAGRPAVGLRVFLKKGIQPVTETWDYAYEPQTGNH